MKPLAVWSSWIALVLLPVASARGLEVGDPAPGLKIHEWVRGEPVDLAKHAAKKLHMVEFWATWCPPCKASVPLLTDYQSKYSKDLVIIGVTDADPYRNSTTQIKDFVKIQGKSMNYTVAIDDRGATSDAYLGGDVVGIPHAFLVGKDGKVVWQGSPLDPSLETVLADVVAGKYDVKAAKTAANKEHELGKRFAALDRAYQMGQMTVVWDGLVEIMKLDAANELGIELLTGLYVSETNLREPFQKWVREHISAQGKNPKAMRILASTLGRIDDLSVRLPELTLQAAKAAYEASPKRERAAVEVYARARYEIGDIDRAIALQEESVSAAESSEREAAQGVLRFYQVCKKLQSTP